ncbi:MAG: hypothetical protein FWH48_06280 [Oscillospiraceae bacterium]|nr:hypothetical protein [Oscillospiraceae bacterium]
MKMLFEKIKHSLFILVISSIVFITMVSCSNSEDINKNDSTSQNQNIPDGETTEEPAEARLYPDFDPVDFGGYEFTFLTRTIDSPGWVEWDHRDIFAEEQNGDRINDAVFNRNTKIEEKYNIKINEIVVENPGTITMTQKSVKAGDDIYDAVCTHLLEAANLAQGGNLLNLFGIPNIDLSKSWWNQGCVEDLSIARKLFVAQGDLLIMDNDAMEAMIFNKSLLKDLALDSPYDIVKSGEWTFDKLYEMSMGVSKDLNGDGKMDYQDDMFGFLLQADTDLGFLVSGGEKICAKDENDYPMITFGSERCYRVMDMVSKFNLDTDNFVNLHRVPDSLGSTVQIQIMEENRALFSWIRMRTVERLRGMETDFGIIPCPKLDKAQEKYITHNNPHTGTGISIPSVASDLERTGMILEDLSAESKYTLQPAYYEINLRGKYVRDDESQEMLDIILSNTAYDIGYIYDFGSFSMTILLFGRDKKTEYASTFEKMKEKMQIDIDKTIAAYENIEW